MEVAGHVQGGRRGLGVSGSSPGDCPLPRFLLQSPARRLEGNTVCLFFVFTLSNPTETHSHSGEQETCCASPLSHLGGSGLKNLTQNFNGRRATTRSLRAKSSCSLGRARMGGVLPYKRRRTWPAATRPHVGGGVWPAASCNYCGANVVQVRVTASAALSLKQPSHVLSLRCCTRVHHSQRRSDDELFAVEEG